MKIKIFLLIPVILISITIEGCTNREDNIDPSVQWKSDIRAFREENTVYGTVIKVLEDDSLIVDINGEEHKVKLAAIELPKDKALKEKTINYTKEILIGEKVELKFENDSSNIGEMLVYIYIRHVLFNGSLIEKGLATVLIVNDIAGENEEMKKVLLSLQNKAKEEGKGLWDKGLNYTRNKVNDTVIDTREKVKRLIYDTIENNH